MGIKKLDWYIIKKFLGSFIVALGLLTVIVIIFDLSEKIDDFVQKEAPLKAIVVDYYLNFIPYFMNMYSPMVVFLTVILFTSKMAQNSEIVAILSCGVSFHRMMVPYLVSAWSSSGTTCITSWRTTSSCTWSLSAPGTIRPTTSPSSRSRTTT